ALDRPAALSKRRGPAAADDTPAVDHEVLAVDETAGIAGEVEGCVRDIVGKAGPRDRLRGGEALLQSIDRAIGHCVSKASAFREDAGDDGAGRNAVDADALLAELGGDAAGDMDD